MDQKIKQTTGTCKYCGQSAMVKIPADWDQEQINEHVSENVCMCAEGAEPRYIKKTTEAAQDGLDILFAKEENDKAKDFLKAAIPLLIDADIDSIGITLGENIKYTMRYKNRGIISERTQTVKQQETT